MTPVFKAISFLRVRSHENAEDEKKDGKFYVSGTCFNKLQDFYIYIFNKALSSDGNFVERIYMPRTSHAYN